MKSIQGQINARSLLACLPLLLLAVPLLAPAQTDRVEIDRIVALVEEDVILKSELDQAIDTLEQRVRASGESMPPRSVVEEQMLERLIMTRLEVLRAENTGIRVSDIDVDNALNRVAEQNNLTLSQLRNALEADGLEFQEFRREIRNEMLSSRLRQRVVNSMEDITETEVDILLTSDRFGGAEFLLSQIVINVPETASPSEVQQARERAEGVIAQIDQGMDFATAAITFSQGPDALEGGDVGWRNLNALPRMFAEAVENLAPGEVSEILRTPAGFVILHVREVRDRGEVIVREFRARHIMVEPSELVSPEEAARRVRDLHERIEQGDEFAELARRYSTDESSANIGGLLNWFPPGSYGPDLQRVINSLEPGELSQPFQTPMGWHIVRLEDVREADRTEEAMRSEARRMLFEQKAEEEVERYLRQLRGEAFVEVRL